MDLGRYSTEFSVLDEASVVEAAEQVYSFRWLSEAYCRALIEAAETRGVWETEEQIDLYGPRIHGGSYDGIPVTARPLACRIIPKAEGTLETLTRDEEMTRNGMSLARLPEVEAAYSELVSRRIFPFAQRLWPTLRLKRLRTPYIIKYDVADPHLPKAMGLHWDQCTMSLVTYLGGDFRGGGTYFPRWKKVTGLSGPGSAVMYPGGLSHEHMALRILSGRRYVLLTNFL